MKVKAERRLCAAFTAFLSLAVLSSGCAGIAPSDGIGNDEIAPQEVASTDTGQAVTDDSTPAAAQVKDEIAQNAEQAAGAPAAAGAPIAAGAPAADELQPKLLSFEVEQLGEGQNRVVAHMESGGFYTLTKTAPSEYVLNLEKAKLDPAANRVVVTQKGQGQIRSVRPVVTGEDLSLRIFAEPETLLTAKSQGGNIVVAAVKAGEDEGRIMAPAAPEALEGQAKDQAKAPAAEAAAPAGEEASEDKLAQELLGGDKAYTGRLISLDLQDTDIDNALRIIAEVSNLNIIASDDVTGKVTLRLIDVPWDQALDVILKTNGLDKVQEGNVIRIAPVEKLRQEREMLRMAQQAEEELQPLRVQYIRVSYAKAAELQPLVETVITERGTVASDERTNQLIVKDISKGLRNVARLVQKLDLRTPQVLIETQIVEAEHNFQRDLGSELGFAFIRSPETGNATNVNFPNSIDINGSALGADGISPTGNFANFPAQAQGSALSVLLGSADGTRRLNFRLSQGEAEGRVRVISRPSVAVTNNTPAVIKAVTKLRVKIPSGGVSVATGQGANAAGSSSVATEVIEVGIVLNVTAQASPDYYVLMDLDAKSSTLGDRTIGVDNIPPEVERKATSTVLVSSGQTFALGGIYQITERESLKGVPWLKDIPVVGHFFRSSHVEDADQELIFFITPRIIEGSFDDAAMRSTL
jgi:type IV pilus assembly protein PilQ